MPESPRYLIASGRKDEALEILRGIAKKNNKELPSKDIVTSQLPVRNQYSSKQLDDACNYES